MGQTAGGAKELWSKLLVAQKKTLVQAGVFKKEVWAFCPDSSFDQSSFAPPAVWPIPTFEQTAVTVFRFSCAATLHCPLSP